MATKPKKKTVTPKAGDTVILKKVPASLMFLKGDTAKIEKKSKTDYTIKVSNGGLLVFSQYEIPQGCI